MSFDSRLRKENQAALRAIGATEEKSELGSERPLPTFEALAKRQTIDPAVLAIRGLTRSYAVTIFSELHKNLNPLTSQEEDLLLPLLAMDEAELASIERPPVYIRTKPESDFDIQLQESEPGRVRFDIEVRKGPGFNDSPASVAETIYSTYDAIMGEINLRNVALGARAGMEQQPKEEITEQVSDSPQRRLSVKHRTSKAASRRPFARAETKNYYDDLEEARFLTDILGIEGIEEQSSEVLVDFWRSRQRSHIAVIDLFMYVVTRKQEIHEAPGGHFHYTFSDLLQYGARQNDQLKLRRELEDQSLEAMSSLIKILPNIAKGYFQSADTELDKLRIRYITWLSRYPSLVGIRRKAREVLRQPSLTHDQQTARLQELYRVIDSDLNEELQRHTTKVTREVWSTFGEIEYDKDIPGELDAYNTKLNFYRTAILLGKYLFTSESMDEAIGR